MEREGGGEQEATEAVELATVTSTAVQVER